jgi:hypothetical protein
MTFDPRKTQVLADFAEVLRGAGGAGGSREAKGALRTPGASQSDATPAVVVARTVIASGEPRSLALAKTQVWRSELTLETKTESSNATRERAQVHVDESVMQHLSAEVWAGQLAQTSRMMVTEVRRSVVDVQATFVETQKTQRLSATELARDAQVGERSETSSMRQELVVASERALRPTPIATEICEPLRIPRRFQAPDAKTLRIAGGVMFILSATIVVTSLMSGRRGPDSEQSNPLLKPAAEGAALGQPVDVKSTWPAEQPAQVARGPGESQASESSARDLGVTEVPARGSADGLAAQGTRPEHKPPANRAPELVARAVGTPPPAPKPASESADQTITTTSLASPRAAVDALIAGKQQLAVSRYKALARSNPGNPVYETAARILEETQQRNAE